VLRGGRSFGIARHWHPVLRTYMIPFITSRTSTERLLPPALAGGISGAMCAHVFRQQPVRLFGIRLHRLLICQSPRRISRLRRARSTTGPAARSAAGPASCSPTPPVPSARSAAISARTRRAALSAGRAGRVRLSDRPGRLRRPGLLLPVRHENEQFPASFLPNNTYIQRVATVTERIGYTVAPTTLSARRA
jgi:hypothetical protein